MELIEYHDVTIAYDPKRPVISHAELRIPQGGITALLGPNGSGKTTLLSVLNRLLRPVSGEVFVGGRALSAISHRELARTIATVPQFSAPSFDYTVEHMILWGRAPHVAYLPRKADLAVVDQTIERMGLERLRRRPFSALSGGEKQLVLIARALAQTCPVILMDEPTTYLDIGNQVRILNTIREINAQSGTTFLVTLHEPNHALYLADEIVLVHHGAIEQGAPDAMLTPENIQTLYGARAAFLDLFDMRYMAIDSRPQ